MIAVIHINRYLKYLYLYFPNYFIYKYFDILPPIFPNFCYDTLFTLMSYTFFTITCCLAFRCLFTLHRVTSNNFKLQPDTLREPRDGSRFTHLTFSIENDNSIDKT